MLKSLVISILLLAIPSFVLAIDKDEALYYANWIDTIQDNNLTLSKAFIYENPSKALGYISQAIANTENNFLKAKCYIQKGIIYNYKLLIHIFFRRLFNDIIIMYKRMKYANEN